MEVYILDSLYRRTALVDDFLSVRWTDRMYEYGDFEFVVVSTPANRNRLVEGTLLGIVESYHVMTVQTVEDTFDEENKRVLKLTGKSLEYVLENRVARGTLGDTTATPKWTLTGTPVEIAIQMFHDICVTGILDTDDIIPMIDEGSDIYPTDTIAPPGDDITYELDPTTLYNAETSLCQQFNLGFRLVKDPTLSKLWFDIYTGCDRTSRQTTFNAVIFSPELDNLGKLRRLSSIALYKNVAYVFSPAGHEIVFATDLDEDTAVGFDRRVLVVNATDIPSGDPDASDKMIAKGLQELAKNRQYYGFDGEISQSTKYKYGVDYFIGDLVEERDGTGNSNIMRVTEQTIVSDGEGDRSYPTLTLEDFVTPGSWGAWPVDETWDTVDPDLDWEDASPA